MSYCNTFLVNSYKDPGLVPQFILQNSLVDEKITLTNLKY